MGRAKLYSAVVCTALISLASAAGLHAQAASGVPEGPITPNAGGGFPYQAPWGAVTPNPQSPSGPTNPGGPTVPSPTPPSTSPTPAPSAAPSAGGRPMGAGGTVVRRRPTGANAQGVVRWEWWWDLNKDRFLGLAKRRRAAQTTTGSHFEGRRTDAGVAADLARQIDVLVDALRPRLNAQSPILRVSSTYGLGLVGARQSLPDLGRALVDDDLIVRETATIALGMTGDPLAVGPLVEVLAGRMPGGKRAKRATTRLRGLAALSLGMLGSVDAVPHLRRAVFGRSAPRELRASALLALGLIPDRESRRALKRALRARWCGATERAVIASAFGYQGDEAVLDPLYRLLTDPIVDVRRSAVLAIGAFPRQAALRQSLLEAERRLEADAATMMSPTAKLQLKSYMHRVRRAVEHEREMEAGAWGKIRAQLRYLHTRDADQAVRAFAAIALGQVGELRDADAIARTMMKGPTETRCFAAIGLGLLARNHGAQAEPVRRVLRGRFAKEKSMRRRAALMLAIGLAGDRDAGEAIAKFATLDETRYLRGFAATSLGLLGDRQHAPTLVALVADAKEIDELINTSLGLALIGGPSEVRLLKRRLFEADSTLAQIAAAVGLGFLGGPSTYATLTRFLRAPSKQAVARAFVAEGLGLATDRRDPTPLARITAGYNFLLRLGPVDRIAALKW